VERSQTSRKALGRALASFANAIRRGNGLWLGWMMVCSSPRAQESEAVPKRNREHNFVASLIVGVLGLLMLVGVAFSIFR
jgi:hypothetical protein